MGSVRAFTLQAIEGNGKEIPVVRINGAVGEYIIGSDLAAFIEYANKTEGAAKIILDSPGGDPAEAFHVYDYVRANGYKLYVDIYGRCASAATIIAAAAGAKRTRIAPNAEFLIHEARGGSAEELESVNERMARVYAELTGLSVGKVRQIMKADTVQDADWAKTNGFVGAIIKLEKLAAKAEKTNDMSTEVKQVKVTLADLFKGTKEVAFDVEASVADQLAANATELKEKGEKIAELEAEITKLKEGITAKGTEAEAEAKAKEAAEAKAKEAEGITAELKSKVEAMEKQFEIVKKLPMVAQVLSNGQEAQIPGKEIENKQPEPSSRSAKAFAKWSEAVERIKKQNA